MLGNKRFLSILSALWLVFACDSFEEKKDKDEEQTPTQETEKKPDEVKQVEENSSDGEVGPTVKLTTEQQNNLGAECLAELSEDYASYPAATNKFCSCIVELLKYFPLEQINTDATLNSGANDICYYKVDYSSTSSDGNKWYPPEYNSLKQACYQKNPDRKDVCDCEYDTASKKYTFDYYRENFDAIGSDPDIAACYE